MLDSIFGKKDLWPSWVADMDFKSSRHMQDALARRVEHGIYGYESSSEALPRAVSAWYANRHGWQLDPGLILFTPRTLASIAALVRLFSKEGDGVIVQPPVFYDCKMIINANGRRLVKNPLRLKGGKYRMDFDHLESVAADPENRLLILCNPHNPIGRVWSKQDLARLSEICAARKSVLRTMCISLLTRYTVISPINAITRRWSVFQTKPRRIALPVSPRLSRLTLPGSPIP